MPKVPFFQARLKVGVFVKAGFPDFSLFWLFLETDPKIREDPPDPTRIMVIMERITDFPGS